MAGIPISTFAPVKVFARTLDVTVFITLIKDSKYDLERKEFAD